jgi:DNA glycosylase AlkZ-like
LDGVICSGPRRGKQFTYALLEERVPAAATPQGDEALVAFAQRYFVSHGPATVQDFAKWSGLAAADARHGLEAVKDQLLHETLNGSDYWFSPATSPALIASPTAYLLSVYDEYITGYKDRSLIAESEVAAKLFRMGAALTYVVVIDGQIAGSWRRTLTKEAVVITINPFTRLTKAEQRAVAATAQRYGEFLGKPAVIAR